MTDQRQKLMQRRTTALLIAGILGVAVLLIGTAWGIVRWQGAQTRFAAESLAVERARSEFIRLDALLAGIAAAAAPADIAASQREHQRAAAALEKAFAAAQQVKTPFGSALALAEAEAARRELLKSERAAFAALRGGNAERARAFLEEAKYRQQQQRLAASLRTASAELDAYRTSEGAAQRREVVLALASLLAALAAVLVGGGIATASNSRARRELADSTEDLERTELILRKSEEYHRLFRHASDVTLILDGRGTVLDLNHKASEVYDIPREMFVGRTLASITHETRNITRQIQGVLADGIPQELDTVHHRADGTPINFLISLSVVEFQGRRAVLSVHRDVTERKVLERQLAHQAFHDTLTGLANRALFRDRVEHALARSVRNPQPVIVMFLDLDNFKTVNDSLGHAAGDQLLVAVAKRLHTCLRVTDTIARFGGDEFAILLEDSKHPEDSVAVAERITAELHLPFRIEDKQVFVGTSIGIASSHLSDTAEELLRNADVAMYIAKNDGKGCYQVFEPHMHALAMERLDLEGDLRRAVDREEFVLQYQPIVNLETGGLTGVEALVRWNHPDRGLIAPGAFIPLAEETGLIVPLGRWVLYEACRQGQQWQATLRGDTALTLTVNISARQLQHSELVDTVRGALQSSGLAADSLILEITESVMMQNPEAALSRLRELRDMGVRIAIDDFGTGYSSLSYLQRFPIDILKIDKSFVDGVAGGEEESALARAVIALGDTLRIATVAEGVSSLDQLVQLGELNCEMGQGYYFAKPLHASEIAGLLGAPYPFLPLLPIPEAALASV